MPSLSGVTAVSAGNSHSLALLSDGTVRAWGDNTDGQLGNGTNIQQLTPVPVIGLSGVSALSAGGLHNLAIVNGGVMAWGENSAGQLGDGTINNRATAVNVSIVDFGRHRGVGGL